MLFLLHSYVDFRTLPISRSYGSIFRHILTSFLQHREPQKTMSIILPFCYILDV